MSLWISPRWWSLPTAAAMLIARCKKRPTSIGVAEPPVERLAAGILEHQCGPTAFADELQRSCCPCPVQVVLQFIFVSEAIEGGRRRMLGGGQHCQHGAAVSVSAQAPSSAEDAVPVLPQDLEGAIPIHVEPSRWIQSPTSSLRDQGSAGLERPAISPARLARPSLNRASLPHTVRFDNFGPVVQAIG